MEINLKIHDISLTTTPETVTWDGIERGFSREWLAEIGPQSVAAVSLVTIGSHTGTHLDAPAHFVAEGGTVEALDVNVLVGPCLVVELFDRPEITAADLDAADIPSDAVRLIFKTDNTRRRLVHDRAFHRDYVGVAPDAARWLVSHGIHLVGVDYLSVGSYGAVNVETHQTLLGAGVVIVETLVLDDISPGPYTLAALPPKWGGAEGCPCRVLLIEGDLP